MAKIPTRLEDLLPLGAYEKVVDLLQRPDLSGRLRDALGKVGIKELNPLEQVQDAWQQAKTWLGSLADSHTSTEHWINATGSLFPSQLDRAPMIPSVGLSWARINSAFQDRPEHLKRSTAGLERIFGTRTSLWLTEPLAALQIVSRALGKNVLIARCDCVRVAGFGDVRAMLAGFGNSVQEVGATNAASESDWTLALSANSSSVIVLVSPSTLPRESRESHRSAAISAARAHGAKVVELLIDGCMNRKLCESVGFPHPVDRLDQNADFVLLPTHFLCGGSRGVLCVGDAQFAPIIAAQSAVLGVEMECAGIAANLLALQLACLDDEVDGGSVGALSVNPENLKNRCQRLAVQLQGVGPIQTATVTDSQHALGASPWDQYRLSNSNIAVEVSSDANVLYQHLKKSTAERPGIEARLQDGKLMIDLRFVHPEDDHHIVAAVREM